MKIKELKATMRNVNVLGAVLSVSEPRDVTSKAGDALRVSDVLLGDDSGEIKLSLWNEDIGKVSVGDMVGVVSGYVTEFRGVAQLNVGRFGKLMVNPEVNQ